MSENLRRCQVGHGISLLEHGGECSLASGDDTPNARNVPREWRNPEDLVIVSKASGNASPARLCEPRRLPGGQPSGHTNVGDRPAGAEDRWAGERTVIRGLEKLPRSEQRKSFWHSGDAHVDLCGGAKWDRPLASSPTRLLKKTANDPKLVVGRKILARYEESNPA